MSERIWFTRGAIYLWPVAWQGWLLALPLVAALLFALTMVGGGSNDPFAEIGFFAAVLSAAFVVYAIATGKSVSRRRIGTSGRNAIE